MTWLQLNPMARESLMPKSFFGTLERVKSGAWLCSSFPDATPHCLGHMGPTRKSYVVDSKERRSFMWVQWSAHLWTAWSVEKKGLKRYLSTHSSFIAHLHLLPQELKPIKCSRLKHVFYHSALFIRKLTAYQDVHFMTTEVRSKHYIMKWMWNPGN